MYRYYQVDGGEEAWKPVPMDAVAKLVSEKHPMFITVLATDRLASKEMPREEKLALKYLGPLYVDFDSPDIARSIKDMQAFVAALTKRFHLDPNSYRVYATGSKGFHIEIPMAVFVTKIAKSGYLHLPLIYKRMILDLAEDTIDWRVYSVGMGRMWRQPNVKRPNGKFKVWIAPEVVPDLTPELVDSLTSSPCEVPKESVTDMNLELAMLFDKHSQDVNDKLRNAKKRKTIDPNLLKNTMPSLELMMMGEGLKPGAGFNQIAMQLAIYARTVGLPEDALVEKCQGLCEKHQSDGRRYNTKQLREDELRRMYAVIGDDPCYEYASQPVRSLLSHPAPDLDGISIDREEIEKDIKQANEAPEEAAEGEASPMVVDEYGDVASGITLTKYGIYGETEFGPRRLSSVSWSSARALRSMDSNKVSLLEVDVLINGKPAGKHPVELSTFHSASELNKCYSRFGHAFNGTEAQAKAVFLRTMEMSKKKNGGDIFVHEREGLSMVNIPHHPEETLRTPFLIWSDGKQVVMEQRAKDAGLSIVFQGQPDTRGIYRCDLTDAPELASWIKENGNDEIMRDALSNLFRCQRPDMVGSMIGWLTACYFKSIFQRAYKQFPLLHVTGQAGSGKSTMIMAMTKLFYYNQDPKIVTPGSTVFALSQCASGTDSIPMVIDEYKPHAMAPGMHDRLLLMFRDAYNARDVQRGGGSRDNDNFRVLSTTALSAPIMFIAEAIEEETAVMERVVLVAVSPPPQGVAHRWASRFFAFQKNAHVLAILGYYLASKLVRTGYTPKDLAREFDPMYEAARNELMLTEKDLQGGLSPEVLREKQSARERSVFNFTVAKFGLTKFQELVQAALGEDAFAEDFADFHKASYLRMKDLAPSTLPEYLKVLNVLVDLSYEDPLVPHAMRYGFEYASGDVGGKETLELSARSAYARYRQYCRLTNTKPLYSGEQAFSHSLRGVSSLMHMGESSLSVPGGAHVFDMEELIRAGLRGFKMPTARRR
ncbi:MAG TPA: hypothetical protein PLN42_00985 [Anaerolineae bacterium]|nr:hypothetical protein [Anaerolineae bacterium]